MKKSHIHQAASRRTVEPPMDVHAARSQESASPSDSEGNGRGAVQRPVVTSAWLLGMRAVWMFLGPMALVIVSLGIVNSSTGWLTALDAGYFAFIALMIGCRWVEQKSGQATTATGEPATWSDFNRYVAALVPLAVVVWIVLNVIGNHVFPGL